MSNFFLNLLKNTFVDLVLSYVRLKIFAQTSETSCKLLFFYFVNFCDFQWLFRQNSQKYIYEIIIQDNILFILEEFESDRISLLESAKNGQIGAHKLSCKIFANFEVIFEISGKIISWKKFSCLSGSFEIFVIFGNF